MQCNTVSIWPRKCSLKIYLSYLINKSDWRRFERILLRQMDSNFPHSSFIGCSFWPKKFDHKFIKTSQNGHFMFWLNELDHIGIHSTLTRRRRRHFDNVIQKALRFGVVTFRVHKNSRQKTRFFFLEFPCSLFTHASFSALRPLSFDWHGLLQTWRDVTVVCGVLAADNVERVDGYVENVTANSLGLVSFLSIYATKFQDNLK